MPHAECAGSNKGTSVSPPLTMHHRMPLCVLTKTMRAEPPEDLQRIRSAGRHYHRETQAHLASKPLLNPGKSGQRVANMQVYQRRLKALSEHGRTARAVPGNCRRQQIATNLITERTRPGVVHTAKGVGSELILISACVHTPKT